MRCIQRDNGAGAHGSVPAPGADASTSASSSGAGASAGAGHSEHRDTGGFAALLRALVAAQRVACSASTTGELSSDDFWEKSTGGHIPRVPPDTVVQDVLRDIFEAMPLPAGLGGGGPPVQGGHGETGAAQPGGRQQEQGHAGGGGGGGGHGRSQQRPAFSPPLRGCPGDSLLARLALHAGLFGNARAVALLWDRFLREIRFLYWERAMRLPRMPRTFGNGGGGGFDEPHLVGTAGGMSVDMSSDPSAGEVLPDTACCLLHQKLQLVDLCIARAATTPLARPPPAPSDAPAAPLRRREPQRTKAKKKGADGNGSGDNSDASFGSAKDSWGDGDDDDDDDEEWGDGWKTAQQKPPPPPPSPAKATPQSQHPDGDPTEAPGDPTGVRRRLPQRFLRWPHMYLNEPEVQPPTPLTEDLMREREAALAALGDTPGAGAARARLQADSLMSDMQAFKAANLHQGGGVLGDFIRWHSPRDWIVDETEPRGTTAGEAGGPADDDEDTARPQKPVARTSGALRNGAGFWAKQSGPAPFSTASGAAAAAAGASIKSGGSSMLSDTTSRPPGRLSERMSAAGSLWTELWAEAKAVPVRGCPRPSPLATSAQSMAPRSFSCRHSLSSVSW